MFYSYYIAQKEMLTRIPKQRNMYIYGNGFMKSMKKKKQLLKNIHEIYMDEKKIFYFLLYSIA